MSRKPTKGIDYTSRDYEAYRTLLIQELQKRMPEYTDTSQTDAGIVILECLANGLDICSLYSDVIANDCFLPTTQDRRLAVLLARQLGYVAKNQTASEIEQVFVLGNVMDRDIVVPKGSIVHTAESTYMVTVYFETMDDLIIPEGKLGNEQDDEDNYLYSVMVQQGTSVNEDLLGTSNGQAYQSFKLNYQEVLVDSIQLMVNEGDGFELWTQVGTFIDSEEDSKHYTVTVDEFDNCYIEFGSGARGKIPAIYDNGIVASYRIGGGTIGNVKPNTITEIDESIAYVEETFNPYQPEVLGHEKESIDEIRENAPAAFRTQDRAITAQDYADLLRINFYDVLSAVGIADTEEKLNMKLYYLMREGYTMTDTLKQSIQDFFTDRIIPGTTMDLLPNEDYTINITANLIIDDDYDRATIQDYVEDYVKNTFFAYGNLVFKDSFAKTDLEHEVKDTFAGVESFRITAPADDIIKAPKDSQIIKLGTLTLNVTGGKVPKAEDLMS